MRIIIRYSGVLFEKKEDTDHSYNWGIMEIAERKNLLQGTHVVLATHNPFSCSLGFTYNEKTGTRMFSFAHLMGMRENWAGDNKMFLSIFHMDLLRRGYF